MCDALALVAVKPPPLSWSRLQMCRYCVNLCARRNEHASLFIAICIDCACCQQTLSSKQGINHERTTLLQENITASKCPALAPRHAIPQLIQLLLLPSLRSAELWDIDLSALISSLKRSYRNTNAAHSWKTTIFYIGIHTNEPVVSSADFFIRHLHGKVRPPIHGILAAKAIGDFAHLDALEIGLDSYTAVVLRILNDQKFAPLVLWEVTKEEGIFFVALWVD
jgi:hypothetical protein